MRLYLLDLWPENPISLFFFSPFSFLFLFPFPLIFFNPKSQFLLLPFCSKLHYIMPLSLQRHFWGWAPPAEELSIQNHFADKTANIKIPPDIGGGGSNPFISFFLPRRRQICILKGAHIGGSRYLFWLWESHFGTARTLGREVVITRRHLRRRSHTLQIDVPPPIRNHFWDLFLLEFLSAWEMGRNQQKGLAKWQ